MDRHTWPSGDIILSAGLGTWRISDRDVEKAIEVILDEFFYQRNPNGRFYRDFEGHIVVVHRMSHWERESPRRCAAKRSLVDFQGDDTHPSHHYPAY